MQRGMTPDSRNPQMSSRAMKTYAGSGANAIISCMSKRTKNIITDIIGKEKLTRSDTGEYYPNVVLLVEKIHDKKSAEHVGQPVPNNIRRAFFWSDLQVLVASCEGMEKWICNLVRGSGEKQSANIENQKDFWRPNWLVYDCLAHWGLWDVDVFVCTETHLNQLDNHCREKCVSRNDESILKRIENFWKKDDSLVMHRIIWTWLFKGRIQEYSD